MISSMPEFGFWDESLLSRFDFTREVITAIRSIRKEKNIPFKQEIRLVNRKNNNEQPDREFDPVVMKLCGISELDYTEEKLQGAVSFIIRTTEFYIPINLQVDRDEEIRKLNEELTYYRNFLQKVEEKLNNEKFISGAPEKVIAAERKKQADALARINVLADQLNTFSSSGQNP